MGLKCGRVSDIKADCQWVPSVEDVSARHVRPIKSVSMAQLKPATARLTMNRRKLKRASPGAFCVGRRVRAYVGVA